MISDLLIKHLTNSIELSVTDNLPPEIYSIEGMSSNKVRNLLNNICNISDYNYMEIGVWKGSTCISSLYKNNFNKAYIIDNWSEFGQVREEFFMNMKSNLSDRINDITIIEEDCFSLPLNKIDNKIDIYFYDGNHSYESQKKALTYFYDVLNTEFIFVVDDWNADTAERGTYDAIQELNLNVKFKTILSTPKNEDRTSYWNGIGLFLLTKI
jgi:hypothetical protein